MKKMKWVFLSLALFMLGVGSSFAMGTFEEAEQLFKGRGTADEVGAKKAKEASTIFEALAATESNPVQKAEDLIRAAESIYFYADNISDKKEKMGHFEKGAEFAKQAASLLEEKKGKVKIAAEKNRLARAYYWFGVNKARWAEANGVLQSLSTWPTVKEYMNFIREDLKEAQIHSYGANRILGKAYMKLPFPLGSNSLAYDLLKEAFEKTSTEDPDGISSYGINVIYYAEILVAKGQKDYAKEILELLIAKEETEESLAAYNPDRIPESRKEIKEAKQLLAELNKKK